MKNVSRVDGNMEGIRYKVKVERFNRLQIFLVICAVMWLAYATSYVMEKTFGVKVPPEAVFLVLVVLFCIIMTELEHYFPSTIELDVEFGENEVIFRQGNVKRKIAYEKICEVEKMMVINRYHSEKGYYRVKIKAKGCSYTMYSGEDSGEKLDFSEVGLSKIYTEFQNRGIKCC